jgi:hypothetical protein
MKRYAIALLLLASCGSANLAQVEVRPGELAAPATIGEPIQLSTERNDDRTRDGFVFVDVTVENKSNEFVSVITNRGTLREGMQMVAGKELAAWIEDEANRERSSAKHRRWAFTALSLAGAVVGVGGAIGNSTTAQVIGGVAVIGGVGGALATDATADAAMFPDDHLFGAEITLAPHAKVQRWFLLRLPSEQGAKREQSVGVDATLTTGENKRDRSYVMKF